MIRSTRRAVLAGSLAAPAAAALPHVAFARAGSALLLHDPALEAGRRLAAAGLARGDVVLPIDGDRIRFARAAFAKRPAVVLGVSRSADALLIEEVGREAGYRPVGQAAESLRQLIASVPAGDQGRVLGWALAPRT